MKARRHFPHVSRRSWLVFGALLVASSLALGACATTHAADRETALILATDRYELHIKDGKVFEVIPTGHGQPTIKRIVDYEQFRKLYEVRRGVELPTEQPGGGVVVNGWYGLDCVREGHACGARPEPYPAYQAVRIRLVFPTR